jgi:hypothetical protein
METSSIKNTFTSSFYCHFIQFVVHPLLPEKVWDKGKSAFSKRRSRR